MFVFCDDYTCKNNSNGFCQAKELEIKIGYGRIDSLKDGTINVCSNYEDARKNEKEQFYIAHDHVSNSAYIICSKHEEINCRSTQKRLSRTNTSSSRTICDSGRD